MDDCPVHLDGVKRFPPKTLKTLNKARSPFVNNNRRVYARAQKNRTREKKVGNSVTCVACRFPAELAAAAHTGHTT